MTSVSGLKPVKIPKCNLAIWRHFFGFCMRAKYVYIRVGEWTCVFVSDK